MHLRKHAFPPHPEPERSGNQQCPKTSHLPVRPETRRQGFQHSERQENQSSATQLGRVDDTALDLIGFDAFEQGFKVAFAKAVVTFALDELKKDWTDHSL